MRQREKRRAAGVAQHAAARERMHHRTRLRDLFTFWRRVSWPMLGAILFCVGVAVWSWPRLVAEYRGGLPALVERVELLEHRCPP